jgi:hypothetical protein
MIRRPLLTAVGVAVLCAAASVATLLGGRVGTTLALFNGETQNAGSAFAAGWIDPPTGLTATASGNNVDLAWTAGTHGPPAGQRIAAVSTGTSASCTGQTLAAVASIGWVAGANSYVDAGGASSGSGSGRGTAANAGDFYCYQVASTYGTQWSSPSTAVSTVVGLVATNLAIANGGTSGRIGNGDRITITFNQKTTLPTTATTSKVCIRTTGVVYLGDTATTCGTSDNPTIATLTGLTIGSNVTFASSTVAASAAAPWTATITLGGGSNSTVSGTATLAATSATTTKTPTPPANQATLCSLAKATCRPTAPASGF